MKVYLEIGDKLSPTLSISERSKQPCIHETTTRGALRVIGG